ncbi:ABC transporter permease [Halobacillus sp. H74]|uniref:ABC transporter permease n=1 Tax=Halobacillus sp. H74 TaxID=3457436 RepID=UPI003FCC64A3
MLEKKLFNNSLELGKSRIVNSYKRIYNIWKYTVDKTVWVYIIFPLIIFLLYHYYELWNSSAAWPFLLNDFLVIMVSFIFIWAGHMKVYVEEGDQLLLLQSKRHIRSLFLLSHIHLFLKSFFMCMLFLIILLPIFTQYLTLPLKEIILWFCYLLILGLCSTVLKYKTYQRFQGIKLYISLTCLAIILFLWTYLYFAYSGSFYMIQLIQLVVSLLVYLYYLYNSIDKSKLTKTTFELNIRNESRVLQFLLSKSAYIGAPEFLYTKNNKTKYLYLILGKNSSLFKQNSQVNGMTEIVIKSFIRNKSWLVMYLQVLSVGVVQLWLIPGLFIKVIFLIVLIAILHKFSNVYWERVFNHSFFNLILWDKYKYSSRKFTYLLITPGAIVFSSLLGYITYSLIGLVTSLVLGILIMHIYIKMYPEFVSKFVVITRSRL